MFCSSCSAQQLKQELRSKLVAAQWRGPHCLNLVAVLAMVHSLLGVFLGSERAVEPHPPFLPSPLPPPPSPLPVPKAYFMVSMDVKHHVYLLTISVLRSENLNTIWRCEHARSCVESFCFNATYINFH